MAWHLFEPDTFTLEREVLPLPGTGRSIGVYSAERSIVDAFRRRVGPQVGVQALRVWLARAGSCSSVLLWLAERLPRAQGPLHEALQYLA